MEQESANGVKAQILAATYENIPQPELLRLLRRDVQPLVEFQALGLGRLMYGGAGEEA
jgi:hypothetical protein